jgi:mannosyltransferase
MRIYCDNLIFSLQAVGGISVYWSEMLRRLLASEHTVSLIERPSALNSSLRRGLVVPQKTEVLREHGPAQLARLQAVRIPMATGSIFHSSYYRTTTNRNVARVVTVHDFTYERFRHGPARWVHQLEKSRSLHAADGIICISQSTRRDLERFYPALDPARVRVIPMGVSETFHPLGHEQAIPEGLRPAIVPPYVLFVGDRRFYKNFPLAVRTLALLPGYSLVMVGGGPLTNEERRLLDRLIAGRYRHVGVLDGGSLNIIYNHAHCLIYPSRYEGFGIPVLEAMRAGCPVVAADNSALTETTAKAGILVASEQPEDWARRIADLDDPERRGHWQAAGLQHAAGYSWQRCYDETMSVYREVLAEKFGDDSAA